LDVTSIFNFQGTNFTKNCWQ